MIFGYRYMALSSCPPPLIHSSTVIIQRMQRYNALVLRKDCKQSSYQFKLSGLYVYASGTKNATPWAHYYKNRKMEKKKKQYLDKNLHIPLCIFSCHHLASASLSKYLFRSFRKPSVYYYSNSAEHTPTDRWCASSTIRSVMPE